MKINPSLRVVSLLSCLTISYRAAKADENVTEVAENTTNFVTLLNNSTQERTENATDSDTNAETDSSVKWVLMVCSTNQCRSPIVESVFKELAKKKGVSAEWYCESAGIYVYLPETRWKMDKRSRNTLHNHGIRDTWHIAREVTTADFNKFDHILGMDEANVEDLRKKAPIGSRAKIELLSSYDPKGSKAIRYPFYDKDLKGFEECYKIAVRACDAFLDKHKNPDF